MMPWHSRNFLASECGPEIGIALTHDAHRGIGLARRQLMIAWLAALPRKQAAGAFVAKASHQSLNLAGRQV